MAQKYLVMTFQQKILNIGYAFEKNCDYKNEIKKWWS